ncbi:hypothetical protein QFZ66_005839 [Streptomyces sp. B4I13]|uniref:hypothetical protein n=1 Tax=Streptomyces sp. B4I13 TaxID=3042271 RepID=UPI002788F6E4|nr:hypothetical protein [Streptomyces sp. B4I13]MDQ0961961.1 hypothetical protein [Streptomyces sp. B4I13]
MSSERPRVVRRGAVVDWVKFDAELARDGGVDPVDKALYAAIASFVDAATRESAELADMDPNNVPAWLPTRKRLAECIGRSVDTVDRSTKRLEAHGLLRVDRIPDPNSPRRMLPSVYELLDHHRWDERAEQRAAARRAARNVPEGGRTDAATPGRTSAATPGRTDAATPGRTSAATPGRMGAAVKEVEEEVEEEREEKAPSARSAADVRRTGARSSARANGGSAATGNKPGLSKGQKAAVRAVEAALPRPLLAALPGHRLPGGNHRAVLAALDARTPEQIRERINRRWVAWAYEPAFHAGEIRNAIGAAMALIAPTPCCPDPACEDGVMVDTGAECRACTERRAMRRAAFNRGEDPRRSARTSEPRPECIDCGRPLVGDAPGDGTCRGCRDMPVTALAALKARWASEDTARAEAQALEEEAARRREARRAVDEQPELAYSQMPQQGGPPPF